MRPTNLNDYYAPNQYKSDEADIIKFAAFGLISLAASLTIQMKPDFNLYSVGRIAATTGFIFCGFKIIQTQNRLDKQARYKEMIEAAATDKVGQRLGHEMAVQTFIDGEDVKRYLPQPEQPQQPQQPQQYQQPQQEYQEQGEYYQPEQSYEPDTNYQEYEEEVPQVNSEFAWSNDLLGYPSVLVWGPQGSGKTSFAEWLVAERLKLGHEIIICDPHREYGQWEGLKVVGDGMNYEAIDKELVAFTNKIKERYKFRSKTKNYNPVPITIICDEFTGWADRCEGSADFMGECLTDIRKVNMHAIFIAHSKTNAATGGKKGMSKTKEAGLLELELEAKVNPQTRKASPKLKGKLRYPGMADKDRIPVKIAPWMKVSSDFRNLAKQSKTQPQSQPTEEPDADIIDVEVQEVAEEMGQLAVTVSVKTLDDAIAIVSHKLQSPGSAPLNEGRTPSQIELLFKALQHHKQNQADTIWHLFGITKSGTSNKYKQARDLYYQLLLETSDTVQEILPKISAITFPDFRLLPAEPGVYFVFDSDFTCYYIGSASKILFRWNSPNYGKHQKHDKAEAIAQSKTVKIGWVLTSDYQRIESDLVAKFKPVWNGVH